MTKRTRPPDETPTAPLRPARRRGLVLAALCALALAAATSARASDGEPTPDVATDAEARAALADFRRASRSRDPAARTAAVEALGQVVHPTVADALLRTLEKAGADEVAAAALGGLVRQEPSREKVMKRVMRWLGEAADAERERLRRGKPSFRVDPRTGRADLDSEEGRLALAATRARGLMLREAIYCVRLLSTQPPEGADALAVFLQDPLDGLVIETLGAFRDWKTEAALPALLDLYRCYPTPSTWETGAIVDLGGTNASAEARWMVLFGHPERQRARPEVVEALEACLEAITGRRFEGPEDLERWLRKEEKQRAA